MTLNAEIARDFGEQYKVLITQWRQSLTTEDLHAAFNEHKRLQGLGLPTPDEMRRRAAEYRRQRKHGLIASVAAADRSRRQAAVRAQQLAEQAERAAGMPDLADLRAQRKALGLSQVALARKLGLGNTTVWSWERGRHVPSEAHLRRYLAALGFTLKPHAEKVSRAPGRSSADLTAATDLFIEEYGSSAVTFHRWVRDWRRSLSDSDVRKAWAEHQRLRRSDGEIPDEIREMSAEYDRRHDQGLLLPFTATDEYAARIAERDSWTDDECRAGEAAYKRMRRARQDIPDCIMRLAAECRRRGQKGTIKHAGEKGIPA
ncbi:MAG: helix-turn-helix domain-containing protein [Streptosporangiaceae bacterium]